MSSHVLELGHVGMKIARWARVPQTLQNPWVQRAVIAGGSYYLGAQGYPPAGAFVRKHGPALLDGIAKVLGG